MTAIQNIRDALGGRLIAPMISMLPLSAAQAGSLPPSLPPSSPPAPAATQPVPLGIASDCVMCLKFVCQISVIFNFFLLFIVAYSWQLDSEQPQSGERGTGREREREPYLFYV